MAGISGTGIDRALYPNMYAQDDKAVGAYGKRAGMAAGSGSARGSAQQNFRQITALDRVQGQQQQAQGYGQMLSQLAMLAAYMYQQKQQQQSQPQTQSGYLTPGLYGLGTQPGLPGKPVNDYGVG